MMRKQIAYKCVQDYRKLDTLVLRYQTEGWHLISVVGLEGDWREFHFVMYED